MASARHLSNIRSNTFGGLWDCDRAAIDAASEARKLRRSMHPSLANAESQDNRNCQASQAGEGRHGTTSAALAAGDGAEDESEAAAPCFLDPLMLHQRPAALALTRSARDGREWKILRAPDSPADWLSRDGQVPP
jgi:hypothetical protein